MVIKYTHKKCNPRRHTVSLETEFTIVQVTQAGHISVRQYG